MTTTKAKCEFYFHMARHTRATPSQVQRLLRYAATLQRLAEMDCNAGLAPSFERKRDRIQDKVYGICREIEDAHRSTETKHGDVARPRAMCTPVFSGDPCGCVLKIRVPDGFSDSMGGEGICVPA